MSNLAQKGNTKMSSETSDFGNSFGTTLIRGENGVHQGNSYVTNIMSQDNGDEDFDRTPISLTNPRHHSVAIARETRIVEGTCSWILKDKEFCSWRDSEERRMLRITGNPGTGKTTISNFLLEELSKPGDPEPICFFCNSRIPNHHTDIAIIRGLLMQLDQIPGLLRYVKDAFHGHHEVPKSRIYSNFDALWELLWRILRDPKASNLVIIIDAIDECDGSSQQRLLDALDEKLPHISQKPGPKFIITSRWENPTKQRLRHTQHVLLHMDSRKTKTGLGLYIDDRIKDLKEKHDYDEELQEKVRKKLQRNAGGTFLWVSLVIDQLDHVESNHDVEATLKTLPNALFGLYDQMLERIPRSSRNLTQFVLRLTAASRRPLTTGEVMVAYHLKSSTSWDQEKPDQKECQRKTDIISSKSDLLYLKKEDNGTNTLHFIHESAREYLLDRPDSRYQRLALCSIYSLTAYKVISCLLSARTSRRNGVLCLIFTALGAYISNPRPIRKISQRFDLGILTRLPGLKSTRIHYHVDKRAANFMLFRICFKTLGFWDCSAPPDGTGQNSLYDLFQYAAQEMHSHAAEASDDVLHKFPWRSELLNQAPKRRDLWFKLVFETMHHSALQFQDRLRSTGAKAQENGLKIRTDLELTLMQFAIHKMGGDIAELILARLHT